MHGRYCQRHYDSTQDHPTHFGASPTVRFRDFPDEVRSQIKLWRRIPETSYNNEKTRISCVSSSFGCRADSRLWTRIANHATSACSPVGKSDDPEQWARIDMSDRLLGICESRGTEGNARRYRKVCCGASTSPSELSLSSCD